MVLLQILYVLVSPLLALWLGQIIWSEARRIFSLPELKLPANIFNGFFLLLGLTAHLASMFFLRCAGFGWSAAVFLPLTPLLLRPPAITQSLRQLLPQPSLNFTLWLLAIIGSGVTLITTDNGISTLWKNNYGDLTFHLGMISSFAIGDNFPPQYHIFPGQSLSYPFFANLWTASAWWIFPEIRVLPFLFFTQWFVLWLAIYHLLDGNRMWLLPWAVLLGGGSPYMLGENSGQMIEQGGPWTAFLTTIWVTQRTTVFGAAVIIAAMRIFLLASDQETRRSHLSATAILLALSPLVHTHFVLVAELFIVGSLAIAALKQRSIRELACYISISALGVVFLPWIVGKGGALQLIAGWMPLKDHGAVSGALGMWWTNAPLWIVFMLWYVLWTRRITDAVLLCAIFILGNFFQAAYWGWDQIKFFIGLYLVSVALWAALPNRRDCFAHLAAILLIVIAPFEAQPLLRQNSLFQVYTPEDVKIAGELRAITASTDVVAGSPQHNSLIALTGRKIFSGYDGTLWSHGINYQARADYQRQLENLPNCPTAFAAATCARFLLWTAREREFWKRDRPPSEAFSPTHSQAIYQIGGRHLPERQ